MPLQVERTMDDVDYFIGLDYDVNGKQKAVSREMASVNKRLNRNRLTKVTEDKPITWEQQSTKGTSLFHHCHDLCSNCAAFP